MKTQHLSLGALLLVMVAITLPSCNKNDRSFNLFTVDQDIELGMQLDAEIESDPGTYPLLDENQYANAYAYLYGLRDTILNGGEVYYRDRFPWEVHIIEDDNTLNAFCAPGGYIYVYTGLIKYLDSEDELIGVLAHEMAHADRRHSTDQMSKQLGLQVMLDVVLGENQGAITDLAAGLLTLKFSRSDESEADEYSVRYLCPTSYNAAGAAGFFQKIEDEGAAQPPQFLSTHPNPDNRITDINQHETDLGCTGTGTYDADYAAFKAMLP